MTDLGVSEEGRDSSENEGKSVELVEPPSLQITTDASDFDLEGFEESAVQDETDEKGKKDEKSKSESRKSPRTSRNKKGTGKWSTSSTGGDAGSRRNGSASDRKSKGRFTVSRSKKKSAHGHRKEHSTGGGGGGGAREGGVATRIGGGGTQVPTRPRGESVFELSSGERAFIPRVVLNKILDSGVPPAPSLDKGQGSVLFVDISGFTALGRKLRQEAMSGKLDMTIMDATEALADRINQVLKSLTTEALAYAGDVAKFAGDALLILFTNKDLELNKRRAKRCAQSMLKAVKEIDRELDIHGGIASGGLMHLHLGQPRNNKRRWYLVTGDAVVRATNLAEKSERGHILYEGAQDKAERLFRVEPGSDETAKQKSKEAELQDKELRIHPRADADAAANVNAGDNRGKRGKRGNRGNRGNRGGAAEDAGDANDNANANDNDNANDSSNDDAAASAAAAAAAAAASLSGSGEIQDGNEGSKTDVQDLNRSAFSFRDITSPGPRVRTETEAAAENSKEKIKMGGAYIPEALRRALKAGSGEPEMRSRVAILFASVPKLTATEEELTSQNLSRERLAVVNDAFNTMNDIVHHHDGEVRDFLFDDKGCVFIGVFGAHMAIEMPELKAVKAGKAMTDEFVDVPVKVGISVGTCFVGMCGNDFRHDFVVMGHEVNMAARFMGKASPNAVLVSNDVYEVTQDFFEFQETDLILDKKNHIEENKNDLDGRAEMARQTSTRNLFSATSSSSRNLALSTTSENSTLQQSSPVKSTRTVPPPLGSIPQDTQDGSSGLGKTMSPLQKRGRRAPSIAPTVPDPNGRVTAYSPMKEKSRRPSFMAVYRYGHLPDTFHGRKPDLKKIDNHLSKVMKDKKSGNILVEGPTGIGKSAVIAATGRAGMESAVYKTVLGTAFSLEMKTQFYCLRQIIESEFGLFDGMPSSKAHQIVSSWKKNGVTVNEDTVEWFIPYIKKLLYGDENNPNKKKAGRRGPISSMRFGSTRKMLTGLMSDGSKKESATDAKPATSATSASTTTAASEGVKPMDDNNPEAQKLANHSSSTQGVSSMKRPGSSRIPSMRVAAGSIRDLLSSGNRSSRKATIKKNNGDPAEVAKSNAQQKEEARIRRKKSRGPDTLNVLSGPQVKAAADLFISLLSIAANNALKTGFKGYVVKIEDIQWADVDSLQVLDVVLSRDPALNKKEKTLPSTVFMLSTRPFTAVNEKQRSNASTKLRNLLHEKVLRLASDPAKNGLRVRLKPIQRSAVDKVVNDVVKERLPDEGRGLTLHKDIYEFVYKKTAGYPLQIVLLLQWLLDPQHDALQINNKVVKIKERAVKDIALAGGTSTLFMEQFDELPVECRSALKIAACIGDQFRAVTIATVMNVEQEQKSEHSKSMRLRDEDDAIELLQPAVNAGIVKKLKYNSNNVYVFNGSVRQNILAILPTLRRVFIDELNAKAEARIAEAAAKAITNFAAGEFDDGLF